MNNQPKIYCVIPAYNEEKNIAEVVRSVKPLVDKVVVVDDSSSDNTWNIVKTLNITTLKHAINRGQGAALETGNQYAVKDGADIIVHFDADGQFSAEEIKDLVQPIKESRADIVFGSRFLGKKSNIPFLKKIFILPLAKTFNRIFFNLTLTDPQSGFRAMNSQVTKKIIIENDGAAHCNEILIKAFKNKLKIKEVPITVTYSNFGQSLSGGKGRGMGGFRIIKDLVIHRLIK